MNLIGHVHWRPYLADQNAFMAFGRSLAAVNTALGPPAINLVLSGHDNKARFVLQMKTRTFRGIVRRCFGARHY